MKHTHINNNNNNNNNNRVSQHPTNHHLTHRFNHIHFPTSHSIPLFVLYMAAINSLVVSDLCLGKPALRCLSRATSTIADALFALKISDDNFISVWNCNHGDITTTQKKNNKKSINNNNNNNCGGKGDEEVDDTCQCVGKVCMADVILYLCKDDNLLSPFDALKAPLSAILPHHDHFPLNVMHIDASSSLLDAIDLILQGAQNLVVPIQTRQSTRRKQNQKPLPNSPTNHNGREFCWLTQEDVIRCLLSSIGLFSPLPALSIDTLNIITTDVTAVHYHSPASDALGAITTSLSDQTSVAVVDSDKFLIGEISPFTLACCDETVAAAITTLSAGDLLAYVDCGSPPEDLLSLIKERLKDRNLLAMLDKFDDNSNSFSLMSSSSSDEESFHSPLARSLKHSRSMSYSARVVRRAEAIVCHRKSSLVAVMVQAIAHRANYVWVVEDDGSLEGIVKFCSILEVFREHLDSMV